MSTVSLNEAEITTMVNDIVKDRTMFSTHQALPTTLPANLSPKSSTKRKPAKSLSQMAQELEDQQTLALKRKMQEEALKQQQDKARTYHNDYKATHKIK